jgi:hypothetical protein
MLSYGLRFPQSHSVTQSYCDLVSLGLPHCNNTTLSSDSFDILHSWWDIGTAVTHQISGQLTKIFPPHMTFCKLMTADSVETSHEGTAGHHLTHLFPRTPPTPV